MVAGGHPHAGGDRVGIGDHALFGTAEIGIAKIGIAKIDIAATERAE
jgi:hypothetical protein